MASRAIRIITPASGVTQQTAASFQVGTTTGSAVVDPDGGVTLSGKSTLLRSGSFTSGVLGRAGHGRLGPGGVER